eukprot:2897210-Pleurochrysis_carterae.AAC.2
MGQAELSSDSKREAAEVADAPQARTSGQLPHSVGRVQPTISEYTVQATRQQLRPERHSPKVPMGTVEVLPSLLLCVSQASLSFASRWASACARCCACVARATGSGAEGTRRTPDSGRDAARRPAQARRGRSPNPPRDLTC